MKTVTLTMRVTQEGVAARMEKVKNETVSTMCEVLALFVDSRKGQRCPKCNPSPQCR